MNVEQFEFDWTISDTHLNHVKIREYEPMRLVWGSTLSAHNDTIINAWNSCIQPGQRVLHLGDWAMGPHWEWQGLRDRLNGDITIILGNHDREPLALEKMGFRILESLSFRDKNLGLVTCRHSPHHFTKEEMDTSDVLLYGHMHSKNHHAPFEAFGKKALCLSIEVLPNTPHPLSYNELVRVISQRFP